MNSLIVLSVAFFFFFFGQRCFYVYTENHHVLCSAQLLSHVQLFATPWTIAHQASLPMGILQARTLEWVAMPFSRGSSQPGDQTLRPPTLQADFLLSEPQGSPIILEWVAYPFSRGIFLTQEWNQGLLHCRPILYQLSSQGSSRNTIKQYKQKRNSHRFLTLQGILIAQARDEAEILVRSNMEVLLDSTGQLNGKTRHMITAGRAPKSTVSESSREHSTQGLHQPSEPSVQSFHYFKR